VSITAKFTVIQKSFNMKPMLCLHSLFYL